MAAAKRGEAAAKRRRRKRSVEEGIIIMAAIAQRGGLGRNCERRANRVLAQILNRVSEEQTQQNEQHAQIVNVAVTAAGLLQSGRLETVVKYKLANLDIRRNQ